MTSLPSTNPNKLSAGGSGRPQILPPMEKGQIVYVLGRYRAEVVDITPQSISVDVYDGLAPGQRAPQRGTFAKELIHHDEIVAKPWWRPKRAPDLTSFAPQDRTYHSIGFNEYVNQKSARRADSPNEQHNVYRMQKAVQPHKWFPPRRSITLLWEQKRNPTIVVGPDEHSAHSKGDS